MCRIRAVGTEAENQLHCRWQDQRLIASVAVDDVELGDGHLLHLIGTVAGATVAQVGSVVGQELLHASQLMLPDQGVDVLEPGSPLLLCGLTGIGGQVALWEVIVEGTRIHHVLPCGEIGSQQCVDTAFLVVEPCLAVGSLCHVQGHITTVQALSRHRGSLSVGLVQVVPCRNSLQLLLCLGIVVEPLLAVG